MWDEALKRIEVVTGDITRLTVQAIVNAANESLRGGGGVDGAIHRAAGPRLLEHNRTLGGCKIGLAKITPGFDLEARGIRLIIHTVGPVWQFGRDAGAPPPPGSLPTLGETADLSHREEDVLLASCYQRSLELARKHDVQSLAFPAISTGVYGFPKERAAKIAFGHVLAWLAQHELPEKVLFCCFSDADADVYQSVIDTRAQWLFNRERG